MKHFIRLARRGKPETCASGGELRARRLALAVLDNVPGLDDQAIAGLLDFIPVVQRAPETARDLVDGWIESEVQQ